MTLDEIISNLEDQAKDRESSIDKDDPECIFRTDAKALREAVSLLENLTGEVAAAGGSWPPCRAGGVPQDGPHGGGI